MVGTDSSAPEHWDARAPVFLLSQTQATLIPENTRYVGQKFPVSARRRQLGLLIYLG